eukprot:TRINITY_DN4350_c0_g1_i1.p1 TRINITY_DN4350_c0_g1~~TRINITY_DN4350_c0_g1_i1.p1  ORF type:complete len:261 (-),score=34.29 TRINITY_DN4350_c0_g1_i1:77-859(-)
MDLGLKDKVVIVTGGAKGIGEAIVRILGEVGAIPVIIGRNEQDNKRTLASILPISPKSIQITAELSKNEECRKAVQSVIAHYHRIDGVVNNAGFNDGVGLASGNYEKFMESLHTNLVHYYLVVHYALPELIKSKGSVVNIGSKTAVTGQGNTSAYAAANGGRLALTREWAVELLKHEVRVNAVIVSESWTPAYAKWIKTLKEPEETLKKINDKIPLGKRMTTPEEIGNMVVFLLSRKSSHTTGQLIYVDGGYVHLDRALL